MLFIYQFSNVEDRNIQSLYFTEERLTEAEIEEARPFAMDLEQIVECEVVRGNESQLPTEIPTTSIIIKCWY